MFLKGCGWWIRADGGRGAAPEIRNTDDLLGEISVRVGSRLQSLELIILLGR